MRRATLKLITIALGVVVATIICAAVVEVWTRLMWNPKRGEPGFYLLDPVRGQRLAANYSGWFAGVPVRINNLGFRDTRDYSLDKPPGTFRILILGDSVTFGHGSLFEHTYPYLFEQLLRKWRPDIRWQVWNAAEPGYNTTQELAQLYEVGPIYRPDLVIVAFYGNDVFENGPVPESTVPGRAVARLVNAARPRLRSFELYRRVALWLAWNIRRSGSFKQRLDHVASEEAMFNEVDTIESRAEQALTPLERFSDEQLRGLKCSGSTPREKVERDLYGTPGWADWVRSVRTFQELNRRGTYRIAFFINPSLRRCGDGDYFDRDGPRFEDEIFRRVLSAGTPAGTAFDEFLHYRPSQLPFADGHSMGNSNLVKAQALFGFLRDAVFPAVPALAAPAQ